jgi:hypothetical protein
MSCAWDQDLRMEESSIARDPDSDMDTCQYWHAVVSLYRLAVPYLHAIEIKRVTIQHREAEKVPQKIGDKTHHQGLARPMVLFNLRQNLVMSSINNARLPQEWRNWSLCIPKLRYTLVRAS